MAHGVYITRSRLWPFWVTWSHWSRDHSIPHVPFPTGDAL